MATRRRACPAHRHRVRIMEPFCARHEHELSMSRCRSIGRIVTQPPPGGACRRLHSSTRSSWATRTSCRQFLPSTTRPGPGLRAAPAPPAHLQAPPSPPDACTAWAHATAHQRAPPAPRLSRHHAVCHPQMGPQLECYERRRAGAARSSLGRPERPSRPPPGRPGAARGREGGSRACV